MPKSFRFHVPRGSAFTLIELMIVVAIVAILAAIAYPSYQSQIRKGRRVDAKNAVLELASREERWFATNNAYSTSPADLGYGSGLTFPNISTGGTAFYSLSVAPTTNKSTTDYSIKAIPISGTDQANDVCYAYQLTNLGVQSNADSSGTVLTTTGCW
jgi:type IV pilus assembly protein PilE